MRAKLKRSKVRAKGLGPTATSITVGHSVRAAQVVLTGGGATAHVLGRDRRRAVVLPEEIIGAGRATHRRRGDR